MWSSAPGKVLLIAYLLWCDATSTTACFLLPQCRCQQDDEGSSNSMMCMRVPEASYMNTCSWVSHLHMQDMLCKFIERSWLLTKLACPCTCCMHFWGHPVPVQSILWLQPSPTFARAAIEEGRSKSPDVCSPFLCDIEFLSYGAFCRNELWRKPESL